MPHLVRIDTRAIDIVDTLAEELEEIGKELGLRCPRQETLISDLIEIGAKQARKVGLPEGLKL